MKHPDGEVRIWVCQCVYIHVNVHISRKGQEPLQRTLNEIVVELPVNGVGVLISPMHENIRLTLDPYTQ